MRFAGVKNSYIEMKNNVAKIAEMLSEIAEFHYYLSDESHAWLWQKTPPVYVCGHMYQ